jgi:hypothetical protein
MPRVGARSPLSESPWHRPVPGKVSGLYTRTLAEKRSGLDGRWKVSLQGTGAHRNVAMDAYRGFVMS